MILNFRNAVRNILRFNKTRMIVCVFLIIITVGTLLLMLPAASETGRVDFVDALFTSTSATCVTGLSIYDTGTCWTVFGQVVILCLIQVGGIGFMTIVTMVLVMLRKNISLSERLVIKESLGIESDDGIVRLTKYIFTGTLFFEGIGAALLSIRFIPMFGMGQGIYMSVFHSVSAFCNAGFDIMGQGQSMVSFVNDSFVCFVLSGLIIIGGLGFIVWEDLWRVAHGKRRFNLHTKIVFVSTAVLLIVGTVLFIFFENHNPETIGSMSCWNKFVTAFFNSASTRTAGFATVNMGNLTESTKLLFMIFMLIGGAPASTAGGIKVVTVFVLFAAVYSSLKGKNEIVIFRRKIDYRYVMRAICVVSIALTASITAIFLISSNSQFGMMDVAFEVFSAVGTVGLTLGITPYISVFSKIILTILMFFGRVGVVTVALSFMGRSKSAPKISYPEEKIIIG